ncbi:protein of unknown function [Verrucomicrobium sp. GAS474]|uniref:DUF5069 domain-containing protein n=1 Tax=Verrucomicrobium sp. GAS474 TaxID=1882831 RepID=UPI00087B78BB|nr:DUF5069 domain-containing protein [Verrucomicrobium sp. GAS474]SDT98214.1 protein of unknown function [Verrucomicrobium sp. GAS474]
MPHPLPELPSAHDAIDGLVYFPRMLGKIRLHAVGKLPQVYVPYLGDAPQFGGHVFDARCCRLLGVSYADLVAKTHELPTDAAVLEWARATGKNPTAEQTEIWSAYASKRGWRDDATPSMREWAVKLGADPDAVLTWFDGFDIDEGRKTPSDFKPESFPPGPVASAKPEKSPTVIPGLPSPYEKIDGVVYFPRMVTKIALAAAGKLPQEWIASCGYAGNDPAIAKNFDSLCCRFLGIDYAAIQAKVLAGETDPSVLLAWAFATSPRGARPSDEEITVWNAFMTKRGWRDPLYQRLAFRLDDSGYPAGAVAVMFDYIDIDEGRPVRG